MLPRAATPPLGETRSVDYLAPGASRRRLQVPYQAAFRLKHPGALSDEDAVSMILEGAQG